MSFLDKLERRFGAWAIPQFALFLVVANGLIYILAQIRPEFLERLVLDPYLIRHGEVWRAITFVFVPPRMAPIWMVFWLLVLFQFAQALEQEWGEFRFCLFYAIGTLATFIASFWIAHEGLSNVPLNTTLFLAFATLYPDFELLLFFILPVKVKYLAALTWLYMLGLFVMGSFSTRVGLGASVINYGLFFGGSIWETLKLRWDVYQNRRRMDR